MDWVLLANDTVLHTLRVLPEGGEQTASMVALFWL
jgi:hypothetical protein